MTYEFISDILVGLRKDGVRYKTILDIGCGRGDFVRSLRDDRIEAFGLDLRPREKNKWVKKGDVRDPKYAFNINDFDIVTANGVLCPGGLLQCLQFTSPKLAIEIDKSPPKKFREAITNLSRDILKGVYNHLRSPGYFINTEDNFPLDHIIYSQADALSVGFKPIIFRENVAMLMKE